MWSTQADRDACERRNEVYRKDQETARKAGLVKKIQWIFKDSEGIVVETVNVPPGGSMTSREVWE